MADKNKSTHDKGGTVHIDAETMKKIEEYQEFIKKNHPEMPVPTKDQIVRSRVNYWHHHVGDREVRYNSKAASDGNSTIIQVYEESGGWGSTAQQFSEDLKVLAIFHISR